MMKLDKKLLKKVWYIAEPYIAGYLLLISIHWLALGLEGINLFHDWFHQSESYRSLTLTLVLLLVILFTWWVYKLRYRYLPLRSLYRTLASQHAYSHLILIVSTPNVKPKFASNHSFPLTIDNLTLPGQSLKADIDLLSANKIRWNWQQLMRALLSQDGSQLQCIYLLGSTSPHGAGSFEWLDHCKALIENYFKQVQIIKKEVSDFENLEELVELINSIIHEAKNNAIDERKIIVDVTGGQKTASIAAALVTLHNRVTFQYVQTNEPYEVIAYNVKFEDFPELPK